AMLSPRPGEPRVSGRRLLGGGAARPDVPGALSSAWARVLHGRHVPGRVRGRCLHDVSRLVEPHRAHRGEGRARARGERPTHRDRRLCHRLAARRWLALGSPRGPARDAGWGAACERRFGRTDLARELRANSPTAAAAAATTTATTTGAAAATTTATTATGAAAASAA